jgi:hypothetical protein
VKGVSGIIIVLAAVLRQNDLLEKTGFDDERDDKSRL